MQGQSVTDLGHLCAYKCNYLTKNNVADVTAETNVIAKRYVGSQGQGQEVDKYVIT